MSTREEVRQVRLAQWRKIFSEKAESGLTVEQFCAINNISRDAYYYWLRLIRQDALSEMKSPALVELKPPSPMNLEKHQVGTMKPEESASHLTVTIKGATISVDANTSRELFAMVLEVLSGVE